MSLSALPARLKVFLLAAVVTLVVTVGTDLLWANYSTGVRFNAWVWLAPGLAYGALVIQPAWSAAVAGATAGGVLTLGFTDVIIVSYGIGWTVADIVTGAGLVVLLVLVVSRIIRIFPNARAEVRESLQRGKVRAAKTEA